jgi:succinyl-diaminopimelate desuccinylase
VISVVSAMERTASVQETVDFLKDLLQAKSVNPPGNEEPVARKIAAMLQGAGVEAEIRSIEHSRANVVARILGSGAKKSLVYSGHMDTVAVGEVPWDFDPFGAEEHEGRIYGRGASDMKSGLAAMVVAITEVSRSGARLQGDLILAATAGEEVDCRGAKALVEAGLLEGVGAMAISEPSNGEIFVAHKGALWVEITCYGKTAHGSMPEQGVNAIEHMNALIDALRDDFEFRYEHHDLLGEPTMNLGVISGGTQPNVVPDVCRLRIDVRTVPGQNHREILDGFQALAQEIETNSPAKFELTVLNDKPSVSTPADEEIVGTAVRTLDELFEKRLQPSGVRYFTDASVFVPGAGDSLPVIIYGPGDEALAHQPNEYVEVAKYLDAITFYKELALRYLA